MEHVFVFPTKTRAQQLLERRLGKPLETYLREEYVDNGRLQAAIADELGVDVATVSRWMRDFRIETRTVGPRTKADPE